MSALRMKQWYIVRAGFAKNQSLIIRVRNPRNEFETGYYRLVAIETAATEEDAKAQAAGKFELLEGQYLCVTSNPHATKGLERQIADFREGFSEVAGLEHARAEIESAIECLSKRHLSFGGIAKRKSERQVLEFALAILNAKPRKAVKQTTLKKTGKSGRKH